MSEVLENGAQEKETETQLVESQKVPLHQHVAITRANFVASSGEHAEALREDSLPRLDKMFRRTGGGHLTIALIDPGPSRVEINCDIHVPMPIQNKKNCTL